MLLYLLLTLQIVAERDPVNLNEADCDDREGHRKCQVHRHRGIQLQVKKKESQKFSADHDRSDCK